ncbi:MAG: type II toxin-antitoxin system VapC family toxin [Candidatus Aminicenantes bacterium]|nr:type II toxin-antitoxin system VapC family toxin [Acidobacteriota bacterium]MCG2814887.1 type II toxin-antitoxin system VapC family toxin [Candidatus Aminicenantes bacterium]
MNTRYLVDTDILVDYLRGFEKALLFIGKYQNNMACSAITVSEIYTGTRESETARMDEFISLFPVLPVTLEIARLSGLYKQQFDSVTGLSLADAVIAATAEIHSLQLKTCNIKHYPMLKNLKPAY